MFLATFEHCLKDEFVQKGFRYIRDSDRCRLYKEIKIVFDCESYMNCNIRQDVRVCLAKLRRSNHKFLVERARYSLCRNNSISKKFLSRKSVLTITYRPLIS